MRPESGWESFALWHLPSVLCYGLLCTVTGHQRLVARANASANPIQPVQLLVSVCFGPATCYKALAWHQGPAVKDSFTLLLHATSEQLQMLCGPLPGISTAPGGRPLYISVVRSEMPCNISMRGVLGGCRHGWIWVCSST